MLLWAESPPGWKWFLPVFLSGRPWPSAASAFPVTTFVTGVTGTASNSSFPCYTLCPGREGTISFPFISVSPAPGRFLTKAWHSVYVANDPVWTEALPSPKTWTLVTARAEAPPVGGTENVRPPLHPAPGPGEDRLCLMPWWAEVVAGVLGSDATLVRSGQPSGRPHGGRRLMGT